MSASQNLKVTWKNVPTRTITAGGREHARSGARNSIALGTKSAWNSGTPRRVRNPDR